MRRQVAWIALALVVGEAGLFFWQNRDVVSLSRPPEALAVDPQFSNTARRVLARPDVTRRLLERIADAAGRRSDSGLQLAALERIAAAVPEDRDVQLRLAAALRDHGRLEDAETIYRTQLARMGTPAAGGSR